MLSKTLIAAAVLLIAVDAGALAAPPGDLTSVDTAVASERVSAAPADTNAAQEEKKICRTEKATGSLTRRNRICLTQAQWREVHDRTRRGVGELQGSASGASSCVSQMDVACLGPDAMGTPGM
jgi:hypothetical protein